MKILGRQETTFQDDVSKDTAGRLQIYSCYNLQNFILIPFQRLNCLFFSLFVNLLLLMVFNDLPNSKLRSITKILMQYLPISYWLLSIIINIYHIGYLVSLELYR